MQTHLWSNQHYSIFTNEHMHGNVQNQIVVGFGAAGALVEINSAYDMHTRNPFDDSVCFSINQLMCEWNMSLMRQIKWCFLCV